MSIGGWRSIFGGVCVCYIVFFWIVGVLFCFVLGDWWWFEWNLLNCWWGLVSYGLKFVVLGCVFGLGWEDICCVFGFWWGMFVFVWFEFIGCGVVVLSDILGSNCVLSVKWWLCCWCLGEKFEDWVRWIGCVWWCDCL